MAEAPEGWRDTETVQGLAWKPSTDGWRAQPTPEDTERVCFHSSCARPSHPGPEICHWLGFLLPYLWAQNWDGWCQLPGRFRLPVPRPCWAGRNKASVCGVATFSRLHPFLQLLAGASPLCFSENSKPILLRSSQRNHLFPEGFGSLSTPKPAERFSCVSSACALPLHCNFPLCPFLVDLCTQREQDLMFSEWKDA